jgi:hypothetical protein
MSDSLEIGESSKIQLDLKSLIGIIVGILSIAGVWFTLTAELPADGRQDLKIEYMEKELEEIYVILKELK